MNLYCVPKKRLESLPSARNGAQSALYMRTRLGPFNRLNLLSPLHLMAFTQFSGNFQGISHGILWGFFSRSCSAPSSSLLQSCWQLALFHSNLSASEASLCCAPSIQTDWSCFPSFAPCALRLAVFHSNLPLPPACSVYILYIPSYCNLVCCAGWLHST